MKTNRRHKCKCGCGEYIAFDKRFVWGHNSRTAAFRKEAHKRGAAQLTKWNKSDEGRAQASRNLLAWMQSPKGRKTLRAHGKRIGYASKGRVVSRKTRDKLRIANTVHGLSHHVMYNFWHNMIRRCSRDRVYVDRGICVCSRWKNSVKNFILDMYPSYVQGLTLDRKNNDGNYTPKNCRWATSLEQSANQRHRNQYS